MNPWNHFIPIDKEDIASIMNDTKKNESTASKAKLYWTIGIIAAILVAALIFWNSGILTTRGTAATVGEQEFSVAEVSYYYQAVANSTIQQAEQYAAFGVDMGYDTSLSPSEQIYSEEDGTTYADYFLDTALQQLQQVTILCTEAEKAGYTLSEEGQAEYEKNMDYLTLYSVQNSMDEASYLKALYGRHMTMSLFQDVLRQSILAEEYAQVKAEEFSYSQEALENYYGENKDDLDSYDFRYCYMNYETEEKTDEDGNTIEATDEEIAAAMAEAKVKADQMVADVQSGTAFNTAAASYVNEASADSFRDDAEHNHMTDTLGSALSSSVTADAVTWLKDASRTAGDITSIEMPDTGYCVVQFLGREKGQDSYQTMDYRTILVMAETDTNEDGSAALPSDEQLTAAKEQAEALLQQWNKGSAEDFAALATQESDDEATKDNGGLVENANRSSLDSTALVDWLFASGRSVGDATVLEYVGDTGNVEGYQVVYVQALGDIRWEYQATSALRSEDYNDWYTEIQESYPAALTEKAQVIPSL